MAVALLLSLALVSGCLITPPRGPVEDESPPAPALLNRLPVALFEINHREPAVGELVSFDGTYSRDPDGIVTDWRWAITSLGVQTGPIVWHTFTDAGAYRVALTVKDDAGAWSSETARLLTVTDPNECGGGCSGGGCR